MEFAFRPLRPRERYNLCITRGGITNADFDHLDARPIVTGHGNRPFSRLNLNAQLIGATKLSLQTIEGIIRVLDECGKIQLRERILGGNELIGNVEVERIVDRMDREG